MLAQLPPQLPLVVQRCATWLAPRKIPAALAAAAIAIGVIAMAVQTKMGAQSALFSVPLHPSQAVEVERALTIWNEPFGVDAQHTQVFVSSFRRRDVLLRLTLAGLPHRYVPTTSDVLDQPPNAFAPQSLVDDRRRAGIEGDLTASLRRINGITDATVVIAPATEDVFSMEGVRTQATASVQLVMQPGSQLSGLAVGGIKRFVAASYPGLTPSNVVVVDGLGALQGAQALSNPSANREARLQNSIQTALDAVFGANTAVVRVSLRNTGDEHSVQRVSVVPHGLLEDENGRERGNDRGKNYERERSRRRWAYDTVTERQITRPDAVAHIAVAVFLDARHVDETQSKLVTDLVRAAAGVDLKSGDQVVVQTLPFREQRFAASPVASGNRANLRRILAAVGIAGGVLALVGLWLRPRLAAAGSADDKAAVAIRSTLQNELPQTAAYVLQTLPAPLRQRVLQSYTPQQRDRILWYINGNARG